MHRAWIGGGMKVSKKTSRRDEFANFDKAYLQLIVCEYGAMWMNQFVLYCYPPTSVILNCALFHKVEYQPITLIHTHDKLIVQIQPDNFCLESSKWFINLN